MLRILLLKDLLRIRRNPLFVVTMLAVPLVLTSLIGMAFGGFASGGNGGGGGGFGRIEIAVVDEDDSVLTRFLRNAATNDQFAEHIDARFLKRDAALALVGEGEISAVIVIPAGFTRGYLTGESGHTFELIKNPAQGMYPALVEEAVSTLVTGLNSVARILADDLREWSDMLDQPDVADFDLKAIGTQLTATGERLETLWDVIYPPQVIYTKGQRASDDGDSSSGPNLILPYILVGMATMFLLYLADHGMRDLYRELRFRTLERYRTANENLLVFVAAKITVAVVIVLLGAAVLFLGGGFLFGISWPRPLPLFCLVLGYSVCAAGLMGLLAAIAGKERRADAFNNIVIIIASMVGGSMFPTNNLPGVFHQFAAIFPTTWFNSTAREMLWSEPDNAWIIATAKLVLTGVVFAIAASSLFRRRLALGARP